MINITDDLLFFTGTECHFCNEMKPLIRKLEQETGVKLLELEVWHNAKNADLLAKLDTNDCSGVPFFYNKKTGKAICGATSYENLKKWALGK